MTSVLQDAMAGIAVAMLLIPQGVAYSSLANESVSVGLVTCVVPPIMYALVGHGRQTSVGPGALESILTGSFIATLPPEAAEQGVRILTLALGSVMMMLGLLRMGFADATMSPPVMKGFQNAVALEVMCSQAAGLFGVTVKLASNGPTKGWQTAWYLVHHMAEANVCSIIVGGCTIVALLSAKYIKSRFRWPLVPDAVLILAAVTMISAFGKFSAKYSLPLLGDHHIPSGLPTPGFVSHMIDKGGHDVSWTAIYGQALANALIMVLVGFVSVIAVSKRMSLRHHYTCSANRELVAFGLTNLVSSYFGAMPAFASMARSELADSAGARSQVFGFVAAGLTVVAAYWLTPALALLPKCCVSALVIVAATGLFESQHASFLIATRAWSDLALLVFTFAATIGFGVETGVLLALMASLLQLVRRAASPHVAVLGRVKDSEVFADVAENPDALPLNGVLIFRIDEANMHSANAPPLMNLLDRLERLGSFHLFSDDSIYSRTQQDSPQSLQDLLAVPASVNDSQPLTAQTVTDRRSRPRPPPPTAILFDMQRVREIDSSALALLLDLVQRCAARQVQVAFISLGEGVRRSLEAAKITSLGGALVFPSIGVALTEMCA
jgi:high affinity sulfate transporter 1